LNRQALVRAALALAALGVCVAGFFTCFEQREIEVATGVSEEARRNHYLALARLLERMGHTVVSTSNPARLRELPPPPATLILPIRRVSFTAERSAALLDWVARGGHLVVAGSSLDLPHVVEANDDEPEKPDSPTPLPPAPPKRLWERPDPILDRFGLRRIRGSPPKEKREFKPPSFEDVLAGRFPVPVAETCEADFPDLDEPLVVGFSPAYQWLDPQGVAVWSVEGPAGVHLVELRHERGRISALTSDEPLTNAAIGDHANAEFVVRWLRRDDAASGPIWIFYAEEWPSLLALAQRHALPAAIAGAVLLFTWLWSAVFRFGPALPDPLPVRRAWLEHLDAAGRFQWRQDHGQTLLASMREEVARLARERHPGWRQLRERERVERIAERADLTPDEVLHALAGPPGGARAFAASVGALERIRAAL
jgi:hypothetical protein